MQSNICNLQSDLEVRIQEGLSFENSYPGRTVLTVLWDSIRVLCTLMHAWPANLDPCHAQSTQQHWLNWLNVVILFRHHEREGAKEPEEHFSEAIIKQKRLWCGARGILEVALQMEMCGREPVSLRNNATYAIYAIVEFYKQFLQASHSNYSCDGCRNAAACRLHWLNWLSPSRGGDFSDSSDSANLTIYILNIVCLREWWRNRFVHAERVKE